MALEIGEGFYALTLQGTRCIDILWRIYSCTLLLLVHHKKLLLCIAPPSYSRSSPKTPPPFHCTWSKAHHDQLLPSPPRSGSHHLRHHHHSPLCRLLWLRLQRWRIIMLVVMLRRRLRWRSGSEQSEVGIVYGLLVGLERINQAL